MPPSSTSRRSSKSGGQGGGGGDDDYQNSERREKAKSSQYDGRRRGSRQVEVEERPRVKSRTNSAPLVDARLGGRADGEQTSKGGARKGQASAPRVGDVISEDAQDSDEEAGVVGAVRDLKPFRSPELSEPLPEINIAVLGNEGVGKSTLVQRALDLPGLPPSQATQRNIKAEGQEYLLRLLEIPNDDADIDDEDDTVMWPETIDSKIMPKIDGALLLYSIKDKSSLEDIPEMLNAISKAGVPLMLIATNLDALFEERQIDPTHVETTAKRSIRNLLTVQTSAGVPETHKRTLSMILRSIIASRKDDTQRSASATRRRAHSNAVRPVSPQPPKGHARASSEYVGAPPHKGRHSRHDSSLNAYGTGDHLQVPHEKSQEEMHGSFLFEETASEASTTESMHESSGTTPEATSASQSSTTIPDNGITFDELVDRLLAQPTSKADSKFCAIFLALYRKFAAPGRLLEAIVERFDALDRNGTPQMMVTVSQLRYLNILEQWLARYPGDFAFPKTKKRMRTFVGKVSQSLVFGAAGKEMVSHLDAVQEDDDTNWAYNDQNRAASVNDQRTSISSRASTLIDDPAFNFEDFNLSGSTIFEDLAPPNTATTETNKSISGASTTSSQIMLNVETAQRQAEKLQPHPRITITKMQWRTLMEIPEEFIAKELTRMDWIMFSSIRPRDLVRQVSLSKSERANCKNLNHVNRMTDHFNHIACWVANYVLLRDKPKHRAFMLEKLMRVARRLRELNNYNALGAFIAGVKSTAIHRLSATRELLPPDVGRDWARLEILMAPSKSYGAYRLAWENSSAERIPYLPLLRRDLVGAEEANKTFIGDEKNGKISWKKFEIQGEVLVNMQKAQGMPYRNLIGQRAQDAVRDLVLDVKLTTDEDELFEHSKMLEPTGAQAGTGTKLREFFRR